MIKEVLLKKSQEIEDIYLVDVCGIIYIVPGTIYIIPHIPMYKQPISTLTAISARTIFKSRHQILKHSIVLDRFIRQINT